MGLFIIYHMKKYYTIKYNNKYCYVNIINTNNIFEF